MSKYCYAIKLNNNVEWCSTPDLVVIEYTDTDIEGWKRHASYVKETDSKFIATTGNIPHKFWSESDVTTLTIDDNTYEESSLPWHHSDMDVCVWKDAVRLVWRDRDGGEEIWGDILYFNKDGSLSHLGHEIFQD